MPHTTTKKQRPKRPDTRPNEKERRKKNRAIEESKSIQDLRVTKKLKSERVERDIPKHELKPTDDERQKRFLKSLTKKMREIESLIERQKNGDVLDEQQLAKIDTLDETMAKMEQVLAEGRKGHEVDDADEENEEADD